MRMADDLFKNIAGSGYQDKKPNFAGFVVIGAGLPRTGTLSLQAALSILLDGPCYHMFAFMNIYKCISYIVLI